MSLAVVYTVAVAAFLALVFSLGFQPKLLTKLNGVILLIVGISGIILYGYGYSVLFESEPQAVIRTLFSVFCMFLGRNEISAISAAPALQSPLAQLWIYLTHLMALYCTASAAIAALGSRLIRTLRLLLLRHRNLNLIFGVNDASIAFASRLESNDHSDLIFVDDGAGSSFESKINKLGSLLFSDADATTPDIRFFRRIGMTPGSRHLNVFCLADSASANLSYARAMNQIFIGNGFRPEQVSLAAILTEETTGAELQAAPEDKLQATPQDKLQAAPQDKLQTAPQNNAGIRSGAFGSVIAIEKPDMLARLMIRECAPYETMTFEKNGLAADNFDALIIGFGLTGQAVLRQLTANGQFAGSTFHATIVASDFTTKAGSFFYRYPALKSDSRFTIIEDNARSVAFYRQLEENSPSLNYIALCTGSDKENAEIAYELRDYLAARLCRPAILLVSETGVRRLDEGGMSAVKELYSPDILLNSRIDAMAMVINHQYHLSEGRSVKEDWAACDYFSRLSCRASADYIDAFLKAAGVDRETVMKNGWDPDPALLENLSRTEHLRWCAFHETMGYQVMPETVYNEREAAYKKEKERTGQSRIRIGKDPVRRLHACLIPWDELDALSARESEMTGKAVDYKEMDRDNVRMIPAMLKAVGEDS